MVIRPTRGSLTSRRTSSASRRFSCSSTRRALGYSRGMTSGAELAGHLDALEALDLVLDPDVVVALHADAALGAGAHLAGVVLEALQRLELALEDDDIVAQHPDRVVAAHVAVDDQAARHGAELARAEHLAHFGKADDLFLDLGREHAGERRADVVDRLVDHAVIAHFHVLVAQRVARRGVRADVEGDHARPGSGGEHDVRLGQSADAARDDLDGDLVRGQLGERLAQRLRRALDVGLDEQVDRALGVLSKLGERVFRFLPRLARQADIAELALTIERDLARLALAVDDEQLVAGVRRAREPQHLRRYGRARGVDLPAALVEQRAHAPELLAGDHRVADLERAALDQHGGHRAAPALDAGLEHDADRGRVLHGLELEDLGLQQERLEQLVDALAGLRGNRDEDVLAAPFLRDHALLRQLVPDFLGIGVVLVELVDRGDDRHVCRLRVLDGFLRLRHDAVVGGNDEDDDVRHLGAARAHRRERRMARRVEEGHDAARRLDVIGADVLRDAARLARRHLGAADVGEQRRLAAVDVAHDRDDRRPRQRLVGGLHACLQLFLDLVGLQHLGDVAHLLDHEHGRVLVHGLVDRRHDAHVEHRLHDFARLDGHALGELGGRDGFADGDLALNRLGRQLEAVLAVRADVRRAAARLRARASLLVPGGQAAGNVQFLAPVTGALVVLGGLARLFLAGAALLLGLLARLLVGLAARLFLRLALGSLLGRAALALLALAALLVTRFLLAADLDLGRHAHRVLALALLVERLLGDARLLLEHVALDIGALAADLDVDHARLPERRRDLDLALGLAAQRDLAWGAAVLGLAVRLAQVRQELVLRILADAVLGAERPDAGFLELRQQLVDRNLEDLGELLDCDVGHLLLPPPGLRPDPHSRTGARAQP